VATNAVARNRLDTVDTIGAAALGGGAKKMTIDLSKLQRLQAASEAARNQKPGPRIIKESARYYALLYVCTDAPGTWTLQEMIAELTDLGYPKSTAQYAVDGLASRGLLTKNKTNKRQTELVATYAGTQAIKPFLPLAGRVKA
jgi:hypothetical protein